MNSNNIIIPPHKAMHMGHQGGGHNNFTQQYDNISNNSSGPHHNINSISTEKRHTTTEKRHPSVDSMCGGNGNMRGPTDLQSEDLSTMTPTSKDL